MTWHPFKRERTTPQPSRDALDARDRADVQLERARAARRDAHEISLQLQQSHRRNHFGAAFEQAMRGTT